MQGESEQAPIPTGNVSQPETGTPDDRLNSYVESILAQPGFPSFAQQVERAMEVLDDEEASANRLAEVVLQNYSLTVKVLQVANSFGANPSGVTVFDMAQAIFRLGVERVRSLAAGMVFFDHFRDKTEQVKQLMALSLVTANQAEGAATRLALEKPEEAYLCGMLLNMGEVLVATYFQKDYERINTRVAEIHRPVPEVCREILGFRYEELGAEIARRWNMPEAVVTTMISAADAPASHEPGFVKAARLAHGLTVAMCQGEPFGSRERVAVAIERFGRPLGLTKEVLERVAATGAADARSTLAQLKLPAKDMAVLDTRRVAEAFGKKPLPRPAPERPKAGQPLFAHIEREVDGLVRAAKAEDVGTVVSLVLEALQKGAGFDRVLFALLSPDRSMVQGRIGLGEGHERLLAQFNVLVGKAGGPIGSALAHQGDISLRADTALRSEEAEQLKRFGVRYLGVMSLAWRGTLLGCLYYDRIESGSALAPAVESGLRRLRDRCVQMLSRKQQAAA